MTDSRNGSHLAQLVRDFQQYARHGQPTDEETTRLVSDILTEVVQTSEAQGAELRHAAGQIRQLDETQRRVSGILTEVVQRAEAHGSELSHAAGQIRQLEETQRMLRLRVYGDGELDVPGMREINQAVKGVGARVAAVETAVEQMRRQLWLAMFLLVVLAAGVPVALVLFYAWWL